MPVTSACLARLGSRFNLTFDPHRRFVSYGAIGLMLQREADLLIGVEGPDGLLEVLPFTQKGEDFYNLDQHDTMTSISFVASSVKQNLRFTVTFTAPFWPQDEQTSGIPAYLVDLKVEAIEKVRWQAMNKKPVLKGKLHFALTCDEIKTVTSKGTVKLLYETKVQREFSTGEGGDVFTFGTESEKADNVAKCVDLIAPLTGKWKVSKGAMEIPFDVSGKKKAVTYSVAMVGYTASKVLERMGQAMQLKYAAEYKSADEILAYVKKNEKDLRKKSLDFDALFADSGLPYSAQQLSNSAFQSYLMNTVWAVQPKAPEKDWFSVWEGSCWYNSTVDVTYNEAMFYFAFWPQLLEKIFEEWSQHTRDAETNKQLIINAGRHFNEDDPENNYDGEILEHDMGAGWTVNGQSYHHAMPVEENANFLIMLYAHGKWWGKEKLFKKYRSMSKALVEYLLWSDSTGNGFPDRGVANTIDDATPAVQYGRDNVYLGIKRLAGLYAAARMFDHLGDKAEARKLKAVVNTAIKSLETGWHEDHYGVCLDKTTDGIIDVWTGKPLKEKEMPGWDAYSLYTTNGLLYLLMIDDLPRGLSPEKFRLDALNAARESMTEYGCGHSSMDTENMWVSMNVWRDCAAGYLGEDMLAHCERYMGQQQFANGPFAEKANTFTETSLTNNLVWYPRGAAILGLVLSSAGLVLDSSLKKTSIRPIVAGNWPLLPLADWKKGKIPMAKVTSLGKGKLKTEVDSAGKTLKIAMRK